MNDGLPTGLPADLLCLAEACRLLPGKKPGERLNLKTLWRWCSKGCPLLGGRRIPAWKIGRYWYVSQRDVLRLASPQLAELVPAVERTADHAWAEGELSRWGLTVG